MQKFFTVLALILFALPSYGAGNESPEWVASLKAAENASQLAIVSGTHGSNAIFSFHEKDGATWREILSCHAYIGKKGWGKTREGDMKTPCGVFTFTEAFGILPDPGCQMGYTKVNETHYWVGDSNSQRYNKMVSIEDYESFSKKDSEHLIDYNPGYQYCLNISWNIEQTPRKGSAIFLHCFTKNKFTAGCVAISENDMCTVLRHVNRGCVVVMDSHKNIKGY